MQNNRTVSYLTYILLYPLIFIFSRLPFWLLYGISDGLYYIIYYIIRYRKKVVFYNLQLAFPDKTASEHRQIAQKFYRHFADLIVEMIKAFHMPLKQMQKHLVFNNPELLNQLSAEHKNIIVVSGHYANWEWVFSLANQTNISPMATYLKINNPYFEKFMLKNRSRFGGKLIETKHLRETLKSYAKNKQLFILGLLADQSPQLLRAKYWRSFLGQAEIPVFTGPEELAKKYQAAYVFMHINKIKRGYYTADFELITTEPQTYPDYQLTDIYIDKLEKMIKAQPAYYLWTHNRFKHMGKQPENKKK